MKYIDDIILQKVVFNWSLEEALGLSIKHALDLKEKLHWGWETLLWMGNTSLDILLNTWSQICKRVKMTCESKIRKDTVQQPLRLHFEVMIKSICNAVLPSTLSKLVRQKGVLITVDRSEKGRVGIKVKTSTKMITRIKTTLYTTTRR